jgi:putative ABC transport system permease protein
MMHEKTRIAQGQLLNSINYNVRAHWVLIALATFKMSFFSDVRRLMISLVGVFLGVSSFLVTISFLRAMNEDMKHNLAMIGSVNFMQIVSKKPENRTEKFEWRRSEGLNIQEVNKICTDLPQVQFVLPEVLVGTETEIQFGSTIKYGTARAVSFGHAEAYDYKLSAGKYFSKEDVDNLKFVCVLGSSLRKALFKENQDFIGKNIVIKGMPYKIVGEISAQTIMDNRANECLIPYSSYLQSIGNSSFNIDQISLLLNDRSKKDAVAEALFRHLLDLHRGAADFKIEKENAAVLEVIKANRIATIVLLSIAFMTLSIGFVGILNVMFASVNDRIREIGVRKALGATNRLVFCQFEIESLIITITGSIPGFMVAIAVVQIPGTLFPFKPILSFFDVGIAAGMVLLGGFLSGFFPSFKASTLQPVEALRY